MADEYITRYDAETAIAEIYSPFGEDGSGDAISREVAMSEIGHIPAADVREVVHARWIHVCRSLDGTSDFECSACLGMLLDVPDDDEHDLCAFCPNCGAMMDLEEAKQDG